MRRFLVIIILLSAFLQTSRGQTPNVAFSGHGINLNQNVASPEVGSLATFGLVPASPFTGQADVNIPLYELSYKDLSVPITLKYDTKGNRADDHPGWTGLGWTLQAGGVIYRKVNGLYDEIPKIYNAERCYYYNCGTVGQNYMNKNYLTMYSLFGAQPVDTILKYAYDASPDEFIFNFNGYSGSFFITRPTSGDSVLIKVKSNGNYKLKADILEMKTTLAYDDFPTDLNAKILKSATAPRTIYKIRIMDESGNQYIFGGTSTSIEFNNNGSYSDPVNTISSAWYLTEIRSPGGYKITFDYKRTGRTYSQTLQRNITMYDGTHSIPAKFLFFTLHPTEHVTSSSVSERYAIASHNPVYLTAINTPSQVINFSSTKSNELNYTIPHDTFAVMNGNLEGEWRDSSMWQKLNLIDIVGIKKIKFNYLELRTRRLQLSTLEMQTAFDRTIQRYTFSYNPLLLPAYNARQADHWGYYTGRSYAYDVNYFTTRAPDPVNMKAEILEKITYPTGGYLKLEYEPNYYSRVALQFPFVIDSSAVSDSLAGGLRIKKITAAPDSLGVPVVKEYYYIKNYLGGGTRSSGVLSGHPIYMDTGYQSASTFGGTTTVDGKVWYARVLDNNIAKPGNTNGYHMTYSEVTEKSNGGYTVYTFSNHDNGYQDKDPSDFLKTFTSHYDETAFTSMEFFRGLPLTTKVYDGNKQLLKENKIEYNIDTTNSEYYVPDIYRFYDESFTVQMINMSVLHHFIRPALPSKITEITYAQGSATQAITTVQTNKYFADRGALDSATLHDNYKPTESAFVTSKQDTIKTLFTYPYNRVKAGTDPEGIYQGMLDSNMNANVITQVQTRNNIQLRLENTAYYKTPYASYRPLYSQQQMSTTDSLYTEVTVDRYDDWGNVSEATKRGGQKVSYLWDCLGQYPVAYAQNAGVGDIRYFSFEPNNSPACDNVQHLRTDLTAPSGKTCYELISGTPFTVSNFQTGWKSSIDHIVSYWSKNGSYTLDGSISMKTGRTLNGWTYYEHVVHNVLGPNITGAGLIDEVRSYPVDALLTTYVYLPNIGILSQCDARGQYTYYEYDSFGRLHIVRDQNKNITKMICYNYKGEVEICNEHIYYNTLQSDSGRSTCNVGVGAASKMVVYAVPAGRYGSDVSQADADAKARAEISQNLPAYIAQNSPCLFYNQRMTKTAVKQCSNGYTGTTVTYVVDSMTYWSPTSTQAANVLAQTDLDANAQMYANDHGVCQCVGEGKKEINGTCVSGQKVWTRSEMVGTVWYCYYHYVFTDGTVSGEYYEINGAGCKI